MSREEAAAKAAYGRDHREAPYASIWEDTSEMLRADYVATETAALTAADAHDRANGIHRIALDDATVERAARDLDPDAWDKAAFVFVAHGETWETARMKRRKRSIDDALAVLAAAVKEEQA